MNKTVLTLIFIACLNINTFAKTKAGPEKKLFPTPGYYLLEGYMQTGKGPGQVTFHLFLQSTSEVIFKIEGDYPKFLDKLKGQVTSKVCLKIQSPCMWRCKASVEKTYSAWKARPQEFSPKQIKQIKSCP